MLVVGLTGSIATGKSAVSNLLRAKNIPIIDADVLARNVVLPGTPVLAKIVQEFGPSILLPDGELDRKNLGAIIFNDQDKRRRLNAIVHPAVSRAMFWSIVMYWLKGEKFCIVDVPLLIEGGTWKWVGKVVVVSCSSEIQLERLMKRDQSSYEDALSRLNAQLPITEKVTYADRVLDNSGSLAHLETQVNIFIKELEGEVGWTWILSWLFPPFGFLSAICVIAWKALRHRPLHLPKRVE